MGGVLGSLLMAVVAAGPLAAQQAGPQQAGPQQAGLQTSEVLQRRTPESVEEMKRAERRVTLDVQATDAQGKRVGGLREQDLMLLDNGRPQAITSFREIDGSSTTADEVVLLLDTMNASFQDVTIERQGIEAYLRENGGRLGAREAGPSTALRSAQDDNFASCDNFTSCDDFVSCENFASG